jgi:hypothetical protein
MKITLTMAVEVNVSQSRIKGLGYIDLGHAAHMAGIAARQALEGALEVPAGSANPKGAKWHDATAVIPETGFANPCALCNGAQKLNGENCFRCNGTGDEPSDDEDANEALDDAGLEQRVRAELKVM